MEEINTDKGNIAAAKYQGLPYTDQDEDPIGLPEGISVGIGKDSKESIDKQFTRITQVATDHGISKSGHSRLFKMLERYRDVFRINFGPDTPAKVSYLVITASLPSAGIQVPIAIYHQNNS